MFNDFITYDSYHSKWYNWSFYVAAHYIYHALYLPVNYIQLQGRAKNRANRFVAARPDALVMQWSRDINQVRHDTDVLFSSSSALVPLQMVGLGKHIYSPIFCLDLLWRTPMASNHQVQSTALWFLDFCPDLRSNLTIQVVSLYSKICNRLTAVYSGLDASSMMNMIDSTLSQLCQYTIYVLLAGYQYDTHCVILHGDMRSLCWYTVNFSKATFVVRDNLFCFAIHPLKCSSICTPLAHARSTWTWEASQLLCFFGQFNVWTLCLFTTKHIANSDWKHIKGCWESGSFFTRTNSSVQ